ncbi:protein phosphatase 1F-like [Styela clava]
MATYDNTVQGFKLFLEDYTKTDCPTDETPLPFRPQSFILTEDEIKGDVLDSCLNVLDTAQCPEFLKYSIANEVGNHVIAGGLEQYKKEIQNVDFETPCTYYSAIAIAKVSVIEVHHLCEKWKNDFPGFKIPVLPTYSVCGIKNTRRKMEDRHTVITDLNALLDIKDMPHTQYYGVFDGHGGLDASVYSSKFLHLRLAQHELFKTDVQQALKDTILQLDKDYCDKSQRDNLRSGTTAVIAVIRENNLYVAWIGDSQAVLVRDGNPVQLMEPHKPDREDEKHRIEELGGCVIWFGAWRVNGTLSVSRAIGDADYKPFVCGDADTTMKEFNNTEDYLCLACDGFWDVFDGEQLSKLVSDHMKETNGDRSTLARKLCTKAKEAGSSDNITVLIVFLRDKIPIKDESVNGKEKVTNRDEENVETDEKNGNNPKIEINNGDTVDLPKNEIPPEGSVMVQGSRLQPSLKDRPPHKIFVNKPNGLNFKVSVIVTESTPHAKLRNSVKTHKSPWQSPQVSPAIERRDTRGSLLSQSTYDSDDLRNELNFRTNLENHANMNGQYVHPVLPAIVRDGKDASRSPRRNTPSPYCNSEPSMSVNHYPIKPPTVPRQSRGRKLYRTSIVMNNLHMENGAEVKGYNSGWQERTFTRRMSMSVPDKRRRRPQSQSYGNMYDIRQNSGTSNAFPIDNGIQKENLISAYWRRNHFDTDIAITNSLHNKIKPKKNKDKRLSVNTNKVPATLPVRMLYRRQRSQSAL